MSEKKKPEKKPTTVTRGRTTKEGSGRKPILTQPLRRVMDLKELVEGDLVLIVANCSPESEEDAKDWYSTVTNVFSSMVETGVHFDGPTWTVRVEADRDNAIIAGELDPNRPGNGAFTSGGGYWLTQIYVLLTADELNNRAEERDRIMGRE